MTVDDKTHVSSSEAAEAADGLVPPASPAPTLLSEPVRAAILAAALAGAAAAVEAFTAGEELRGALSVGVTVAVAALGEWARAQVTPLRDPKLADGVPLTVADDLPADESVPGESVA